MGQVYLNVWLLVSLVFLVFFFYRMFRAYKSKPQLFREYRHWDFRNMAQRWREGDKLVFILWIIYIIFTLFVIFFALPYLKDENLSTKPTDISIYVSRETGWQTYTYEPKKFSFDYPPRSTVIELPNLSFDITSDDKLFHAKLKIVDKYLPYSLGEKPYEDIDDFVERYICAKGGGWAETEFGAEKITECIITYYATKADTKFDGISAIVAEAKLNQINKVVVVFMREWSEEFYLFELSDTSPLNQQKIDLFNALVSSFEILPEH